MMGRPFCSQKKINTHAQHCYSAVLRKRQITYAQHCYSAEQRSGEGSLMGWKPISDCIVMECFQSQHLKTTMMQVNTPTRDAEETEKDAFFGQVQDTLNEIPNYYINLLISDMNVQIDNDRQGMGHMIRQYRAA